MSAKMLEISFSTTSLALVSLSSTAEAIGGAAVVVETVVGTEVVVVGVVGVAVVVEAAVVVTCKLLRFARILEISLNMSPLLPASFDSAFGAVVGAAVVVEAVVGRTATGPQVDSQFPV